MGTNHIQLPWPHTWVSNTSNCHSHTRGHQPHPTGTTKLLGTNHIQLPQPHTWAPNKFNCHRHTRGCLLDPTATATRADTKPHPTATAIHASTNHIQLAPPNTWAQITSNCHSHTRGHQTHSTVTAIHMGDSHTQLLPPHAWAHNHTQLLQPHTLAQTTSNWHHQTRGYQSHPIDTATGVGTKHIQLSPPYTWASTISNRYRHTRGTPTTHNCHSHTRWHKQHPIGITKLVGTIHIHLSWTHTWASNTSNCQSYLATDEFQLPPPYTWTPTASI